MKWNLLTTPEETGGATIRSYNLQWHAGPADPVATWLDLAGAAPSEYTADSFVVNNGIVRGNTYSFRVIARSIWGEGPASETAALEASRAPLMIGTATTSIDSATGDLVVAWPAPDDRGSPVLHYRIEVRHKPSSGWDVDAACDGTTDAAIVSNRQCSMPMLPRMTASVAAGGFGYALDDIIYVRVSAENGKAWSAAPTAVNVDGAKAKGVPAQPAPVTRGRTTSTAQVQVDWTTLATTTETGGLPITSFALEYDKGTG